MNLTEPQQARLVAEVERLEREKAALVEAGDALRDRIGVGPLMSAEAEQRDDDAITSWDRIARAALAKEDQKGATVSSRRLLPGDKIIVRVHSAFSGDRVDNATYRGTSVNEDGVVYVEVERRWDGAHLALLAEDVQLIPAALAKEDGEG